MVVKPGTKLYDEVMKEIGYDYFDAFLRGKVKEIELPMSWTVLNMKEIRKWVLRAYFSFYFRKEYIHIFPRMAYMMIKNHSI